MKAVALISGGLDSTLATRIIQDLGLELIALNTVSPFCLCNSHPSGGCFHGVSAVVKSLGLRLVSVSVSEEMLEIVKRPKYGYGSNMNPCIDCRILLFRKAKSLMQQEGAAFVITGEVLGQRPMSQKLQTMRLIERESGLEGLVLRPLSARVLEATIPEKEGWVDRESLFKISGRGRRQQFTLAAELGIKDYPCPSGGCLLTDPEFSKRLADLLRHGVFSLEEVRLLKLGRHFRVLPEAKLVVGRNEKENNQLLDLAKAGDYLFYPLDLPGPTSLARGALTPEALELCFKITARYCDHNGAQNIDIAYRRFPEEKDSVFSAPVFTQDIAASMRI